MGWDFLHALKMLNRFPVFRPANVGHSGTCTGGMLKT